MWIDLFLVAALIVWSWWLGGKAGAPRRIRWVGIACAIVWASTRILGVSGLVAAFVSAGESSVAANERAAALSTGVARSTSLMLFGSAVLGVGLVVLLAATWRWRRSRGAG